MRHLKDGRKLNRTASHRKALFRNMVTSLLEFEKITTTLPKAKELKRYLDKMITLGKQGDLAARRRALSYVQSKDVVHKLFTTLAERYATRKGGYSRIFRSGVRVGDNAPMAIIELVDRDASAQAKRRVKRAKEEAPAAEAPAEAAPKKKKSAA